MPDAGRFGQTDRPMANLDRQMARNPFYGRRVAGTLRRCDFRTSPLARKSPPSRSTSRPSKGNIRRPRFRPPMDFSAQVEAIFKRVKGATSLNGFQAAEVKQQILGQLSAEFTDVPAG